MRIIPLNLGNGDSAWRVGQNAADKAACLCVRYRLTSQPSRRRSHLSAAKESMQIPTLLRQQQPVANFPATLR